MEIEQRSSGEVTVLKLTGQLDAFQVPAVSTRIDRMIRDGAHKLIFDCGRLEFINSGGIGYLIKTQKSLRGMGGELVLASASESVLSPIRVLRVDEFFRQFPDVAAAESYLDQS